MVAPGSNGTIVVLQSNAEKTIISEDDVEEASPSKVSAMPDGLLNSLTLEDIADLFAYLANPARPEVSRRPARVR